MKRLIFLLFVFLLISNSCKKDSHIVPHKRFPSTSTEIEESVKNTQRIGKESGVIVESAISEAYNNNSLIDPNEIARKIGLIEGVQSATPTTSGTGIVIEQDDSTFSNILIATEDDERLYKLSAKKTNRGINIISKNSNDISYFPNGHGRALILAPFQVSFKSDLDKIVELLESAGYAVDSLLNSHATLEKFRGNFLNNYDIIFIRTHGVADIMTWGGTKSTALLTGEEFNLNTFRSLSLDEKKSLLEGYHEGSDIEYFGISVPWLNLTTIDGNFTNTWVYAGACESALGDDNSSLSKAFLNKGAGGYNGWDVSVTKELDNPVSVAMTAIFSSGLSFQESSNAVRSDPTLQESYWNRLLLGQEANIEFFRNIQLNIEPFFLIKSNLPTLTTIEISMVSSTTALGGGLITSDGGASVFERGACWSTSPNPTIENSKTLDGRGIGEYNSNLSGLNPNTAYYVRAFAMNSSGIAYGNQVSFTTLSSSQTGNPTDIDGNNYNTITIGSQVWMVENLKSTHYNDGSKIPLNTDNYSWYTLTTPAYCWYNNDSIQYKSTYGALYNWYSIDNASNGGKNVCPTGWHVPLDTEWASLIAYLGGENNAGSKLKEEGTAHWLLPNDATNESGFTALPGGRRENLGAFSLLGMNGDWWSATENNATTSWYLDLYYGGNRAGISTNYKLNGCSIRCLRDN